MDRTTLQNVDRLESILAQAVQRQEQLVALLERKRKALRSGEAPEMVELSRLENAVVQTITELEKRRLQLVADLTLALDPTAAEPLKMKDLAERLPEPYRGRLLVTRTKLIEAMQRVAEQTSVIRRASESLSKSCRGKVASHSTTERMRGSIPLPGSSL